MTDPCKPESYLPKLEHLIATLGWNVRWFPPSQYDRGIRAVDLLIKAQEILDQLASESSGKAAKP